MDIRDKALILGCVLYCIGLINGYVFVPELFHTQKIEEYSTNQWCDAIKHEEGATYGVGNFSNPRQVCINTVLHKHEDWLKLHREVQFIDYLSTKYCPLNSASWAHNVQYWLNKGK